MTPAVDTIATTAASPAVAAGMPLAPDDIPTRSQTTRMIYSRHRRALRDYARSLDNTADPS
ncbi:hypothetical protein [Komagataeibacter sp. FNDCF1]|uniref:hypothetical protein n=1 Tax=Komagataeibacter sp. FNDCF1 TaxID=2878681 RepID=UPI001E61D8E5|nr:hypothetical protein [Komagataeibacter sp. FNDCF1]MCE2564965.1 hypothetical protein [Komagataeibacter sp. FNDCF1]